MGIEIAALTEATILQSVHHQRRYGLLTNDSLIVATMLQQGVRILATADRRLAVLDDVEIVGPADLAPAP
jgi:predicted nucleic acid-binding protein